MKLITLGRLELPGAGLKRPKLLLLLAYLALEGPQPRRTLAKLFWPESKDPPANLRMALHHLRQNVPGGCESTETLVVGQILTDATELRKAARQNAVADVERLYQGPFLRGTGGTGGEELEEWIHTTREELAGLVRSVYRRAAGDVARSGDHAVAAEWAVRALYVPGACPPSPEDLKLLYPVLVQGQHGATAAVRKLAAEFGLALAPVATASPGHSPDRSSELEGRPDALVGREREIREVLALLERAPAGLVTVLGPGGVGKSRLAAEVAGQIRARLGGQQAWVSLESVPDANLIPARILDTLDLSPARNSDGLPLLVHVLRGQPTVLVLDNFEHLIDREAGDGTEVVAALLAACPALRILITSREPLHLSGEVLYPLGGLSGGAAGDAATLFVQRARLVQPDFQPTAEQDVVLDRLCSLLGGLPQGIELAAAWVRKLPLAELADELAHNLNLLTTEALPQPGRHTSLRAVFNQSWQRLTLPEQDVLRRVAVFQGGFTLQAAIHVAGASASLLTTLIDRSLLRLTAAERYEMHPLLGQFAAEQLARTPELQAAAREAHTHFFVALAETAGPELYGPNQEHWFGPLSADQANLREATEWCQQHDQPDLMARMQRALWIFGYCRESYTWGLRQIMRALQHPRVSPSGRAILLRGAGVLSRVFGDTDTALSMLTEATELAEEHHLPDILLVALIQRGLLLSQLGEPVAARRDMERGLRIAAGAGNHTLESYAHSYLGQYLSRAGQYGAAEPLLRFAVTHARQYAGSWQQALATLHLANHLRDSGQLTAAEEAYAACRALLERLGGTRYLAECLADQATLQYYRADHAGARQFLEQSLHLLEHRRAAQTRAACFALYGRMALDEGRLSEAKHQLLHAVQEYQGAVLLADIVILLPVFARLAWRYGEPLLASECLRTFNLLRLEEKIEPPLPERGELDLLQQRVPVGDGHLAEPLPLPALMTQLAELPTLL
ncbi:ATP-binding protein [Deinococcus frigens]|uniref:ATP-binding protein n=1 Tax=Deinococcus frigens TaxID=249403 RepID=UPI000554EEB7|nr:AAA family ATPase [Deinococcus frigens]